MSFMTRIPITGLLLGALCLTLPLTAWSAAGDDLYYQIGGGGPVSASAGRGYQPGQLGLGISWDEGSACSGLNPQATVANQLNGVTRGFQNMMGSVVQSATAAVAALPAMIIQRAAPGLYDLLSNGVLQGRLDFNKAKTSCKAIAGRAADEITGGWQRQAEAENWRATAAENEDAVAAQQSVEATGGNKGVIWVGGEKRGGTAQEPINVTHDTAVAGYNILHGRTDPTSTQPVSGGGQGWGSVPTPGGSWPGGDGSGSSPDIGETGSGCNGGMCTVWGSPQEASQWITDVIGEKQIQTCSGCEKVQSKSGTGLMRALEDQQNEIQKNLTAMVNGSQPITDANLRAVSAGATLAVSRGVIKSLRHDPQGGLLTHRLASEMALARTLTQALWARRILLAGADEPGIANNDEGQDAINNELTHLDRGIEALRTEIDVRRSLAHNAATMALTRNRASAHRGEPANTGPGDREIDTRGAIDGNNE
ncbi:hypothetical protein [Salinisphaera hydrothermalis]|nr:hypothetical protein [Salinisphaera hydrothermalis]